jgi:serine/threonine protein kinase
MCPPLSPRPELATVHKVLETRTIQRHHNRETGNPTINNYEILRDIGAGVHGKVKLAKDLESGTIVAIKIINRKTKKKLGNYDPNEQENKIKREIAIMKKCHHPNIVNLIEVIDNPDSQKVYLGTIFLSMETDLVLEYMERGEIKWKDRNNRPILTVDEIRPMIRDVVLGLEYLHFQGIIHRDIKPGNLLIANDGTVKISDFGVSHLAKMDEAGNLLPENDVDLAKTAGSPAFFAPELCQFDADKPRVITKAIDVWALGITMYCLLFGREPFPGVYREGELFYKICNVDIEPPEECAHRLDADARDLLRLLLTKPVQERIKLHEVRRHPFITKDIPEPKKWAEDTDLTLKTSRPLEVTPLEVDEAVTSFRNIVRRTLAQVKMTAKRSMSYLRPRHVTGRVISGVQSPVTAATAPNSPPANDFSAGLRDHPITASPKSDTTDNRPKMRHAYFDGVVKEMDVTPPTPPDSGKVENVVPNGHVNGNGHHHAPTLASNGRKKSVTPPSPLTPPPIQPNVRLSQHLNDDYSNVYYSDDDSDINYGDEDDDDDDEERLEIRFGGRNANS